jgi:hypothetical protein
MKARTSIIRKIKRKEKIFRWITKNKRYNGKKKEIMEHIFKAEN